MIKTFKKLSHVKKLLFIAILFYGFSGMPFLALNPAIEKIHTEVFPQYSLTAIQSATTSVNLFSIAGAVVMTILKQRNLVSKRLGLAIGMAFIGSAGVVSFFVHSSFWNLYLLAALIGIGLGINTIAGLGIIMVDFDEDEVSDVCGGQSIFVQIGGILMSLAGGLLASRLWYGGYVTMLIMLAFSAYVFVAFRKSLGVTEVAKTSTGKMTPIPKRAFYNGAIMLVAMLLYNVCGGNVSTHIAMNGLGDTSFSGLANSMCMVGGIIGAFSYVAVSNKLGDYIFPSGAVVMALGYLLMSLFPHSAAMVIVGMFLTGASMGFIPPQVIGSTSRLVDESNSALVALIVNCVCSAVGCQLSPIVMTGITTKLGGDSTSFRFAFTGICCLVMAVILFFTTRAWIKKEGR